MAKTEIQSFTFPGWFVIAGPLGPLTVRASLAPSGIQIEIPTPRRSMLRTVVRPQTFAGLARQASHLEAVIALASLIEPAALEQALALVLETCEDAAEAWSGIDADTSERVDALTWIAAAVRGTIAP